MAKRARSPSPLSRPRLPLLAVPLLLAACGESGGGGATAAGVRFAPAAPVAEGATGAVLVELVLGAGALEEALAVRVRDTGEGTALPGADYAAVGDQTVVFPPGARAGARLPVHVTALTDDLAEGPEDVVLELAPPEGAMTWGARTVVLVIDDLDVGFLTFAAAAASAEESDGTASTAVRLELAPGVQLARDAAVRVRDSASGTATSGSDYDPFPPRTLLFPAGSVGGDQAHVDVVVRDDETFQGDQTVVLVLEDAQGSAVLGAQTTHTLTIVEDDVSQAPFLAAAVEFGPPVVGGDAIDLGAQSTAHGPTGGVVLAVENLGLDPFTITAPTLSGPHAGQFRVEVQAGAAGSPPVGGAGGAAAGRAPTEVRPAPLVALGSDGRGARAALDAGRLAAAGDRARWGALPHPDLAGAVLVLERLPDPWRADGVLRVDGEPAARPDVALWGGAVEGEPGSDVFLALSLHGSRGWIRRGDGRRLDVLSDPEAGPGGVRLVAATATAEAGPAGPALELCGGALLPPGARPPPTDWLPPAPPAPGAAASAGADPTFTECRLALETDHQFHQLFGDADASAAYATALIGAVAVTYRRDLQTTLTIAYLGIYTTPDDPWVAQDSFGTSVDVLNEFRAAWAGGGWPAAADLAHFLSGEVLGGGVAYIGTLCNSAYGFGVSGNLSGAIDWESFSGQPSGLNWDFLVVAHELGHNFGTLHTHQYCPPLDTCAPTVYWGSCQASRSCDQGTIMSYCHLCAGGTSNVATRFHPQVANVLRGAINASCLGRTEVPGGGGVRWRLRFDPAGAPGPRATTLWFGHGATNVPSPFQVHLLGTAE